MAILLYLYFKRYKMNPSIFLKQQRKQNNLTQEELAAKAGVGLRLVREIEQGKKTMRMDKVNQILALFGAELIVNPSIKKHG
jgi:y4mF family transcriptional regulator